MLFWSVKTRSVVTNLQICILVRSLFLLVCYSPYFLLGRSHSAPSSDKKTFTKMFAACDQALQGA